MNNQNEKTLFLDKSAAVSTVWMVTLIGIAALAPFFHQQMITGTIVNATLFAAAIILGKRWGGLWLGSFRALLLRSLALCRLF